VSPEGGDHELVDPLRRSAPGAFDAVYRRHAERVWRFLARLCGSVAEAQDVYQDTWLAAARNAHRLREGTALVPWLLTIARNKQRNALRFRALDAQRRARARAVPPAGPVAPDEQAAARQGMARLQEAFRRLPQAHREVLLLSVVEGLDGAAVARVLDLSEHAVRKRLSRARAALEEEMGDR
jgi:RNA polymerase sigma-70 factor (ECF subfamily)